MALENLFQLTENTRKTGVTLILMFCFVYSEYIGIKKLK